NTIPALSYYFPFFFLRFDTIPALSYYFPFFSLRFNTIQALSYYVSLFFLRYNTIPALSYYFPSMILFSHKKARRAVSSPGYLNDQRFNVPGRFLS
ncbi:hypothetical protein, partial [Alteribacter natronophilus]|uniref:hypothetical protein n=1 Tax=Alteribacter natronophilus TaxID=2583810 RepID=UPI001AEE0E5F